MTKITFILALFLIASGCSAERALTTDSCQIKPVEASITKADGTTLRGIIRLNSKQTSWQIRNADGVFYVPGDEVLDVDIHTPI